MNDINEEDLRPKLEISHSIEFHSMIRTALLTQILVYILLNISRKAQTPVTE